TFLNRATTRVPILYVSEENPRTLAMSFARAGLTNAPNILPAGRYGLPWPQLMKEIERLCAALDIAWLILDTFYAICGLGGEEENRAGSVDDALRPVRQIVAK